MAGNLSPLLGLNGTSIGRGVTVAVDADCFFALQGGDGGMPRASPFATFACGRVTLLPGATTRRVGGSAIPFFRANAVALNARTRRGAALATAGRRCPWDIALPACISSCMRLPTFCCVPATAASSRGLLASPCHHADEGRLSLPLPTTSPFTCTCLLFVLAAGAPFCGHGLEHRAHT